MNTNEMAEVVEKLAEKLGVAAEHLWGVLIRQAPISGITNILVSIAWIVGAIWTFRFVKSKTKDQDVEVMVVGWAICVARREILADFGICYDDRIENLGFPGCPENSIMLSDDCFDDITLFFEKENITVANGTFLTVNCVSGTSRRRHAYRRPC